MKASEFCYWLQGYFEIQEHEKAPTLNVEQVQVVRNHLALVFKHEIDPSYENLDPQEAQQIHDGMGGKSDSGIVHRC